MSTKGQLIGELTGRRNDERQTITLKATNRLRSQLVSQFDLFPEQVTVEPVDVRGAAGERSRIKAMYVVRFERSAAAHQVFHDHHGWYCAEHGQNCRAVGEARKLKS
jgi:hypothetical protein